VINECEHVGIEKVEAPRQRLEQLFMDIVEKARREQVATSGAMHGGQTASFLRAEPAEGEAVIGALLQDETAPARARAKAAAAADNIAPAKQQRDEVLSELLDQPAPAARPAPARPRSAPGPSAPAEVDSAVIDSLIKPDGGKDGDRPKDRRE
jgi:hypothetical protein